MNLRTARFQFEHPKFVVIVTFDGDTVTVCWGVERKEFTNKPGKCGGRRYKPCVTHAKELAARVLPKTKAKPTAFAERRERQDWTGPRLVR